MILQAIYHFLLVVCSISVSTLHRFNLEKSFTLNTTVEITGYVHLPIHV